MYFTCKYINKHIKKSTPKCYICKKILRNRSYSILDKYDNKMKVCSNCKNIYDTFMKCRTIDEKGNRLSNIYEYIFGGYSREYIIKRLQKTNRNGIFIKPSNIVGFDEPDKYFRMQKKCCCFCEKQFIKHYTSIKPRNGDEIRVCGDCEYLFRMMLEEKRRKKESTVRKIYELVAKSIIKKLIIKKSENYVGRHRVGTIRSP